MTKYKYKIVVYAIADRGEGDVMEIGRYDHVEEINDIKCWMFDRNTQISIEYEQD